MSKRRSVAIVHKDNRKVIAQTSELTDTPVRQRSYVKHEINWDNCFIRHRDSTEKLQSSLEVRSTDNVKAYEEIDDHILKFESLNALAVPMEVDELSRSKVGTSLFNHSAKFHKTCKLKFGKEKLEKAIKWDEKQDHTRTLEKHLTLKGKWNLWSHSVFITSSHSYHHYFFTLMILLAGVLPENIRTSAINIIETAGFPVFQFLWNFSA